jgi:hypothetical protein
MEYKTLGLIVIKTFIQQIIVKQRLKFISEHFTESWNRVSHVSRNSGTNGPIKMLYPILQYGENHCN